MSASMPVVGFAGVGSMGAHMVRRLLEAGLEVHVCDLDAQRVATAVEQGAAVATSPRTLADACDVVCLSLPRPQDVELVALGADGVVHGARVSSLIDFSTTGPEMARTVAARLGERGISALDAPVSGGPRGAEHGTLCIMCAGDRATFERHEPMLSHLGASIVHLGTEPGQGQTMKVINNTISASCMTASCEGLALGSRAGLDAEAMVAVLNASMARNTHTEDKIPRCVLTGSFDFGFQLALMLKDVRLCLGVARELEVPMLLATQMQQLMALQVNQGPDQDITEIMRLFEEWAETQVRAKATAVRTAGSDAG